MLLLLGFDWIVLPNTVSENMQLSLGEKRDFRQEEACGPLEGIRKEESKDEPRDNREETHDGKEPKVHVYVSSSFMHFHCGTTNAPEPPGFPANTAHLQKTVGQQV